MSKTVELITDNGTRWKTSVNGDLESVCRYFLGKWFDVGSYPEEKMERVGGLILWDEEGNLIKDLT